MKLSRLSALGLFLARAHAQDIITVLESEGGLTKFQSYLQNFPDLVVQLNTGDFTVLAPTDDALNAFASSSNAVNTSDSSVLQALLDYHVIQGVHPSASFSTSSQSSQFLPTLLTDSRFANVSGGQRVEVTTNDGAVKILSAVKESSRIVRADSLFTGGVIHSIDSVLVMPMLTPITLTDAKLNDLIGLLGKYGWLTDPDVLSTVDGTPNLSLFVPNSPNYSSNFTGFEDLSTEELKDIFEYSLVASSEPIYSTNLTNGTVFTTVLGKPVTVTLLNNATYINNAKVIDPDYLITNGVIQILDSPLDPNNTNARPTASAVPTSSSSSSSSGQGGLSLGAKAGIAIAITIAVVFAALLTAVMIFRKRRLRREQFPLGSDPDHQPHPRPINKDLSSSTWTESKIHSLRSKTSDLFPILSRRKDADTTDPSGFQIERGVVDDEEGDGKYRNKMAEGRDGIYELEVRGSVRVKEFHPMSRGDLAELDARSRRSSPAS